jgi:Biotin carboxylase
VAAKSVLFVGAGRHQRRAILRAQELGLRTVAVDRNADALGLAIADAAEVVDFQDVDGVFAVAQLHGVDGVLTISADRAVPIVAAVAERLGLPGIGTETAHLMTHKIAMRRRLAEAGVPQPRFAGARDLREAKAAAETVGFPAC